MKPKNGSSACISSLRMRVPCSSDAAAKPLPNAFRLRSSSVPSPALICSRVRGSASAASSRYQWTPAAFAPGVSVAGRISSTSCSRARNSSPLKARGALPLASGRHAGTLGAEAAAAAAERSGSSAPEPVRAARPPSATPIALIAARRPKRFAASGLCGSAGVFLGKSLGRGNVIAVLQFEGA